MFSKLWVRLLLQQLLDAMCFHRRLDSRPHCVAACDEATVFFSEDGVPHFVTAFVGAHASSQRGQGKCVVAAQAGDSF